VGFGEVQVGFIISCSALAFTLTSQLWGHISDRWGRKPVLLLGLFGYTFGCFLFASVFFCGIKGLITGTTLYLLVISSRVFMASLMSAAPSSASAYIADTTSVERRVAGMGQLGAARTLGTILGPALCGLLAFINLLAPLYIAAGITLVSTFLVAMVLQEPVKAPTRHAAKGRSILLDKRVFPYALVGFATFFTFSVASQTLGFYIQDRFVLDGQATAQVIGLGMMTASATSFLAQVFLANRHKLSPIQLMTWGLPIAMISYGALLFAGNITLLVIVLGLLGFGLGLASPGFTAGASLAVGPEEQGAVSGLMSACPAAGFVLGPVAGTYLYQLGQTLPYICAFALMLPLIIYVLRLARAES
jgi:MFS family permease